uniref:Uncharacterized protein n=1 Tax=Anguilla anguilla TaxID=7936 RepID=A0A0E9P939_ANGAN
MEIYHLCYCLDAFVFYFSQVHPVTPISCLQALFL